MATPSRRPRACAKRATVPPADKRDIRAAGIDTGRRKLGAIIGDHVEIGINSSINVGCTIGNNAFIGPGVAVSGVILPDAKIL